MKKILETLWLVWLLAWSPNANAWVEATTAEANKNLIEVVSQGQDSPKDDYKTISFEAAQELQNNQKLMEAIMSNEKIQKIMQEYWQEGVKQAINWILTNKAINNVINSLKDEKVQQSIEEWNELEITEDVWGFFSFKLSENGEPMTIMDVILTMTVLAMLGGAVLGIWIVVWFMQWDFLLNYNVKIKNWRVCICKRELTDLQKEKYEWNGRFWVLKTDIRNRKYPEEL